MIEVHLQRLLEVGISLLAVARQPLHDRVVANQKKVEHHLGRLVIAACGVIVVVIAIVIGGVARRRKRVRINHDSINNKINNYTHVFLFILHVK